MLFNRLLAVLLLLCCQVIAAGSAHAQSALPRKLADKPMAILYARSINERTVMDYFRDLSTRMDVGESMMKQIEEQPKTKTTESDAPVSGQLVYLVQGLIPSMEWVSFQSVVDEDEAAAILKSMTERFGENSRVEEDDGDYQLINHWESETPLAEGQKPEDFGFGQNQPEIAGFERTFEIVEKDGQRVLKGSQTMTQHFRYFDGLLYCSRYGALTDVSLPAFEEIRAGFLEKSDAGAKLYADRVPQGIRLLSWNMLSATMGTQLQQRDGEDTATHEMRSSAGRWALELLRSAIFDVDYGEGEGYLASGREPLRGRLQLRPRRNSQLIRDLEELGGGRSRFAPLLREESAASIHLCAAPAAEGKELFTAIYTFLSADDWSVPLSPAAQTAWKESLRVLEDIAEDGTVEVLLRVVRSDASGSVILGGLQVGNSPELLEQLNIVFRELLPSPHSSKVVQRHGRPIIQIQLAAIPDAPVQISNIWIAHRDDCLWVAAGGENAHEMIRIAAESCGETGRVVHTRLLTAKLDLDHWMSWPEDDPTGLSRFPLRAEEMQALNPLTWTISVGDSGETQPSLLLKTILAAERSDQKKVWLTLTADKTGLLAEAELGRAIAEYWLASLIDMEERMMQRMREQQQKAADAAAKLKAAASPAPETNQESSDKPAESSDDQQR